MRLSRERDDSKSSIVGVVTIRTVVGERRMIGWIQARGEAVDGVAGAWQLGVLLAERHDAQQSERGAT